MSPSPVGNDVISAGSANEAKSSDDDDGDNVGNGPMSFVSVIFVISVCFLEFLFRNVVIVRLLLLPLLFVGLILFFNLLVLVY